ncbi:MAG TPA: hypothetical protein PKB13_10505 [Clostridia bacterium]|nr:hypothetical protein [Clostridia bacterium]
MLVETHGLAAVLCRTANTHFCGSKFHHLQLALFRTHGCPRVRSRRGSIARRNCLPLAQRRGCIPAAVASLQKRARFFAAWCSFSLKNQKVPLLFPHSSNDFFRQKHNSKLIDANAAFLVRIVGWKAVL